GGGVGKHHEVVERPLGGIEIGRVGLLLGPDALPFRLDHVGLVGLACGGVVVGHRFRLRWEIPPCWRAVNLSESGAYRHVPSVTDVIAEAVPAPHHCPMQDPPAHDPLCRYRLLVEGTTDYAIFTTSLDGVIETWNPGAARIFGYESGEILGQNLEILFTPEDRAREVPALERHYATETGRASDHRWHVRKDRSRFWASGVMMALRSPAGTVVGLAKIIVDATESRRAEDALAASEHQFRALVTASPLSMLILNIEGWPLTANPAWERRWNTTVEALQASPRSV